MKNLEIKAKVLEYSKALPAEGITLKVFISPLFNIRSVHQRPLVVSGEEGGEVVRGFAIMWKCKVVEDRKNVFFTNLLIRNSSKGLSYMKYII